MISASLSKPELEGDQRMEWVTLFSALHTENRSGIMERSVVLLEIFQENQCRFSNRNLFSRKTFVKLAFSRNESSFAVCTTILKGNEMAYYVLKDGQKFGPYDAQKMKSLANTRQIVKGSDVQLEDGRIVKAWQLKGLEFPDPLPVAPAPPPVIQSNAGVTVTPTPPPPIQDTSSQFRQSQQLPPQQGPTIVINNPDPSQALPAVVCFFLGFIGQLIQGRVFSALIWFLCDILMGVALFLSLGLAIPALLLYRLFNILDAALYKPSKGFRVQPLTATGVGILVITYALIFAGWSSAINSSPEGLNAFGPTEQPSNAKPGRAVENPKDIVALEDFKTIKANNANGGNYFTLEVPEGAVLLTVWTKSIEKSEKLQVYMNSPANDSFPSEERHEIATEQRGWGSDRTSNVTLSKGMPKQGTYRFFVAPIDGGCDYTITAHWQVPMELKIGQKAKIVQDDPVTGWKYFFVDIPDDIVLGEDHLYLRTSSIYKSSSKCWLLVNTPEDGKYPSSKAHRWSTEGEGIDGRAIALLNPHSKEFTPGRYYVAVISPVGTGDESFDIVLERRKTVKLKHGESLEARTNPGGDFYLYEARASRPFTVEIFGSNGYILINGPDIGQFPTSNQYQYDGRYLSGNCWASTIRNPSNGPYYFWVGSRNGTNYTIQIKDASK